jgi:uncharacterized membrane protein
MLYLSLNYLVIKFVWCLVLPLIVLLLCQQLLISISILLRTQSSMEDMVVSIEYYGRRLDAFGVNEDWITQSHISSKDLALVHLSV